MADQQQYTIEDNEFKHGDTTHVMKIRFLAGNRFTIYPDKDKSFVAKVGTANGAYLGTYPVSTDAGRFIVKSADLEGLGVGDYRLEIWEKYTDSNGEPQIRIFPSPKAFVNFTINKNIEDTAWDLVKDISFQDLVNTAVTAAGQNIVVIATNTLPAGSQASVTQKYENGKNEFTFNIPRGEQGVQGNSGKPFSIAKVFPSKDAMTGDGLSEGDFVMIASNVDDPNNATLFTWDGTSFKEIADLSGAQGIQGPAGPAPTLHVTKVTTVPNGGQPSFTATSVGNGNYNVEIGLPKGDKGDTGSRGYNFWAMKMTAGGNVNGRYITDLYSASTSNLPEVNDLVVQPDGNVYIVTNVVKDTTPGAGDGGGTFDLGPAIFSIKGDKGNDAVINVISQAEYDALADKSGVYFIEG